MKEIKLAEKDSVTIRLRELPSGDVEVVQTERMRPGSVIVDGRTKSTPGGDHDTILATLPKSRRALAAHFLVS